MCACVILCMVSDFGKECTCGPHTFPRKKKRNNIIFHTTRLKVKRKQRKEVDIGGIIEWKICENTCTHQ